ncbi:hypothetical protein DPMN_181220 [Dreissena polymorpha]|uniref:Uncharacterized protein n=1 Tax=Dreissena polymorpha TaxID=45954 RepID=A0A9D4DCF1_DREPO|nr:hypothetical protein DPMN_181220 [Dreissena polymorpha]
MSEYGYLCKGIGTLPGKSKLSIREDAIPVVTPPRRKPLKSRLKSELEEVLSKTK